MEEFWRASFFVLLLVGCVLQGLLLFIIWKPLRDMKAAASNFESATDKLNDCVSTLGTAKRYDDLAKMQLEQAKNVVERVPEQIEQGVQKAIVAAAVLAPPASGISGRSGEIQIHS